jgi:hypothetical protein
MARIGLLLSRKWSWIEVVTPELILKKTLLNSTGSLKVTCGVILNSGSGYTSGGKLDRINRGQGKGEKKDSHNRSQLDRGCSALFACGRWLRPVLARG